MQSNRLQQAKDVNFEVVFLLLVASVALTDLFLYCYFGKLAAESYEQTAVCFFECDWLELPKQFRQYFIIMIANAQQPHCYAGFKLAVLNLDTFCTVIWAAVSKSIGKNCKFLDFCRCCDQHSPTI